MKNCPICKQKIEQYKYDFVVETINDPVKLDKWLKGEWTLEKYMELK